MKEERIKKKRAYGHIETDVGGDRFSATRTEASRIVETT